jgi:hypothetical protein
MVAEVPVLDYFDLLVLLPGRSIVNPMMRWDKGKTAFP